MYNNIPEVDWLLSQGTTVVTVAITLCYYSNKTSGNSFQPEELVVMEVYTAVHGNLLCRPFNLAIHTTMCK